MSTAAQAEGQEPQGEKRTIGQMNGRWGTLFKVTLVVVPICVTATLTLMTWLIPSVIRNNEHRSRAAEDQARLEKSIAQHRIDMELIDERIDALPPGEWRDKINDTDKAMGALELRNTQEHMEIKMSLIRMEGDLKAIMDKVQAAPRKTITTPTHVASTINSE